MSFLPQPDSFAKPFAHPTVSRDDHPTTASGRWLVCRYGVREVLADTVAELAGFVWREANDE